ncbi:hypothetical protein H6G76_16705 [Nostoc sp. FACHB-152]|uniref:asparagine synthase-related protein n=1 Tax=unclassified Nostoc TaxID=2593658 RepID=UPI0016841ABA|nr:MULTISPECIES: asparagine synthase-related protein [unclassified Nostoc]MBD2448763.1 hypothetical protein [Nostoc sp. FACHB-152]MBD2467542.1 hypothetical protein [Nostoc sp. FACHB-145]
MITNGKSLVGQFILCQSENYIPENWNLRRSGSWLLGFHSDLPVIEILASDSSLIGWLLGYAIDTNGLLLNKSLQIPVFPNDNNDASQLESSLYDFGGRFLAIFLTKNISRVYLDPLASLSAVFCAHEQIVASSTALIPYSEDCQDNYELIKILDIPNKNNWYPFGLTPRHSVERLLPNHFLNLNNWQSTRHWHINQITTVQNKDIKHSISEIASIAQNNIKALVQNSPVYLALTAGRDSRMLLACAREHLQNIELFTVKIPDQKGIQDCELASQIAKTYKLNHRILELEEATEAELNEWLYRTGNCVAGRTWRNVRTLKQLDPQRGLLLGMAGEIGRAIYWSASDTESTQIAPDRLLNILELPVHPYLEERGYQWLNSLGTNNAFSILDLLFIEQRLGCWAGPQQYGHITSAFRIFPLCHRKIIELMLSLPPNYKRSTMMVNDLINNLYPELLRFPFNNYTGLKRYFNKLKNIAESYSSTFKWKR